MTARRDSIACALRPAVVGGIACAALFAAVAAVRAAEPAAPRRPGAALVTGTSAAAAVAAEDPVERLRQRLVERLGAGRAADGAVGSDLRLSPAVAPSAASARREAGAVRTAAASPAPAAAPKAAAPAAPTAGAGQVWSYEGAAGPAAWASLSPEYALCAQGQRQSPIDLRGGLPVELEPLRFGYQASRFSMLDTGRTLEVKLAAGPHLELGGRRYELQRIQFHRPAEHRVDGRTFEMGAHLMHVDAQGRELVVAVLFDPGPALPVVQTLWGHVPLEPQAEVAARVQIDPAQLLPVDRRYFTYMGSLTTPPCHEGVQWVVLRTPVTLSAEQIEVFARLYPLNARPLQAAGGRRILQSE